MKKALSLLLVAVFIIGMIPTIGEIEAQLNDY